MKNITSSESLKSLKTKGRRKPFQYTQPGEGGFRPVSPPPPPYFVFHLQHGHNIEHSAFSVKVWKFIMNN